MTGSLVKGRGTFGTAPVFLTAISTILGAIMFLRFGYAVGHVGFVGTLAIIMVGHLVTIPTAMALAEIATNQKVEGGGEYYIISRSFGITIGAAIGIALFFSQAISVAFYVIAFGEAFDPVFEYIGEHYFLVFEDKRIVSAPALLVLAGLILTKGADLGIKVLYFVVGILFLSLLMFFMGNTDYAGVASYETLISTVESPDAFFLVFAICFPAFTGMTAGVGLSGDLKDPRKSIPLGTLAATAVGMFVYVAIAYKLATSAAPDALVADQLIMRKIALWGPIIPIGLACATASSALGSALVAPRTLQALSADGIFPSQVLNSWLGSGRGKLREPVNASIVVFILAGFFVVVGDVNFVAQIISMFFMVTYGSICLISFLDDGSSRCWGR
jgi:amino acid transporter